LTSPLRQFDDAQNSPFCGKTTRVRPIARAFESLEHDREDDVERKPMIELSMLVAFGAALCGASGLEMVDHWNRAAALPCRFVWQQYWDFHACARDSQRCGARAALPTVSKPCIDDAAATREAV
jgi:hypothetical protein